MNTTKVFICQIYPKHSVCKPNITITYTFIYIIPAMNLLNVSISYVQLYYKSAMRSQVEKTIYASINTHWS